MLTRVEISGFKNLAGVTVDFGPYTCIAGPNAIGKSNLFDAIEFLSHLSSTSFFEAAQNIRSSEGGASDPTLLFHTDGTGGHLPMEIAVEMLVDPEVYDDFGQRGEASITYLRYEVELRLEESTGPGGVPVHRIVLQHESLVPLNQTAAKNRLRWLGAGLSRTERDELRRTLVQGAGRKHYIRMGDGADETRVVNVHVEGTQGRPLQVNIESTQRTVLSTINTIERPTVLAVRREMQNWRKLALEPSAMRAPDDVSEQRPIGADGAHLPIALSRLLEQDEGAADEVRAIAMSLTDVSAVRADVDVGRRLVTLEARLGEGDFLPARVLSEGTLRFLALAILRLDPSYSRLLCMEEPENGIHPGKIPEIVELLHDLAFDPSLPLAEDNSLRQVIVNTHSPHFVAEHQDDELLVAVKSGVPRGEAVVESFVLAPVAGTWRDDVDDAGNAYAVPRNRVDQYLQIRPGAPQLQAGRRHGRRSTE